MHTQHFKECESTNDEAWKAFDAKTPMPALFIAEKQTKGRGQNGRIWVSDVLSNLYMSLLAAPPTQGLELIPLAAGVAVAHALSDVLGIEHVPKDFHLRWPNDLYISGAKFGGILCESRIRDGQCAALVVGVGVNVGFAPHDCVQDRAVTSLKDHVLNLDVQNFIYEFSVAWSQHLLQEIHSLTNLGKEQLIQNWNKHSLEASPLG